MSSCFEKAPVRTDLLNISSLLLQVVNETSAITLQLELMHRCDDAVVEVDSRSVVPLDTLLIPRDAHRYKLCADCVLLAGSAFVDESMLTGRVQSYTMN